jgi:CRP-like cAMP-binding protein
MCRPMSSSSELDALQAHRSRAGVYKAGSNIYHQGDPAGAVYNVLAGWLCLYQMLADGRRQLVHFALPGAVIGLEPDGIATRIHDAVAQTDVTVCVIPRKSLAALRQRFNRLNERFLWLVERDEALAYEHLTSLGRHTADERIAHLLLELFCRVKARFPSHPGDIIELPLTQDVIADAVGLTAIHVNRTLRALREAGILEVRRRQLRILDIAKLTEMAGLTESVISLWISDEIAGLAGTGASGDDAQRRKADFAIR